MNRTWMVMICIFSILGAVGCKRKSGAPAAPEQVPETVRTAPVSDEVIRSPPQAPEVRPELVQLDAAQRYIPAQGPEDTATDATGKNSGGTSRTMDELLDLVCARQSCNPVMGCAAEEGLVAIGEPAVKAIIGRYRVMGRPNYQKFHLLRILGRTGHPSAIPFLVELLEDPHWNVRTNAALALADLNAASELKRLKRLLRKSDNGRDFGFLYALAYAVEKMGGAGGGHIVLEGLEPERISRTNWGYTKIAVDAAGSLGLTEACPKLPLAIRHNDIFLKKAAIEAAIVLQCRDQELKSALEEQSSSQIPSVRRLSKKALDSLAE